MKKTKTQEIVYGAMLLALYAVYLIIDRYSGGMLYLVLYYFLPLPFVYYGLKFSRHLFLALGVGALVLGFICGLMETAFFGLTAILVAYMIVLGIEKNYASSKTVLIVLLTTIVSQVLSITLFASLFGYDMASDLQTIASYIPITSQHMRLIPSLMCLVLGSLEAFLFITLTDIMLLRMKMERLPKFSLSQLHFSKPLGLLFMLFIVLGQCLNHDIILFLYMLGLFCLIVQGLSCVYYFNAIKFHKPLLNSLGFLCCFVPFLNYFMAGLGLLDIFTKIRDNNRSRRGGLV